LTFRIPAYNINCVINLNQLIMIITTQQELDDLIAKADESNTIVLDEDLEITFNCEIPCNIKARDIKAWKIKVKNITAHNIKTDKIDAINIKADKIDAYDIIACNIKAKNIKYHAFCIAYESLKCNSISGIRENSFHKCLDQEIEIR